MLVCTGFPKNTHTAVPALGRTGLYHRNNSRGRPAQAPLLDHATRFCRLVFPGVLFCIGHPTNHNFQRLFCSYFVKSTFGSPAR